MRDGALLNAAESIVDLLERDPSTSPSPRLSALSQRFGGLVLFFGLGIFFFMLVRVQATRRATCHRASRKLTG